MYSAKHDAFVEPISLSHLAASRVT